MTTPRFEIRPLGRWDRKETEETQSSARFRAKWDDTVKLLLTEADLLGAPLVVLQVDADPSEIRRDGMLRARASVGFRGVKVSFQSDHGPLTYATDVYDQWYSSAMPGWQANVRAIALSLTALRAVDRYGVTHTGEQYRGFTAISDKPAHHADLTETDAILVFGDALGHPISVSGVATVDQVNRLYRTIAKQVHPEAQGPHASAQVFQLVTRARDVLLARLR